MQKKNTHIFRGSKSLNFNHFLFSWQSHIAWTKTLTSSTEWIRQRLKFLLFYLYICVCVWDKQILSFFFFNLPEDDSFHEKRVSSHQILVFHHIFTVCFFWGNYISWFWVDDIILVGPIFKPIPTHDRATGTGPKLARFLFLFYILINKLNTSSFILYVFYKLINDINTLR